MTSRPTSGSMDPMTEDETPLAEANLLVASALDDGRQLARILDGEACSVRLVESVQALKDVGVDYDPDVLVLDEVLPGLKDHPGIIRGDGLDETIGILLVDACRPRAVGRALKLGVESFVHRESSPGEVLRLVEGELRRGGPAPADEKFEVPRMDGVSDHTREVCRKVAAIAPTDATVLITGDSGTGKELVARWIHRFSPRRAEPFAPLNCGAIPDQLIESKLFGHVEGAFTGATSDRPGQFEAADGGTLFLDEVGELSSSAQVKLLRVLQQHKFEPVGSTRTTTTDVRLIAATNTDLRRAVDRDELRRDLYYRLNVVHLELPPLRKRPEDIRPLWRHFVRNCSRGDSEVQTDSRALRCLMTHDWPGNVRELENAARHATVMRDKEITAGGLPADLRDEENQGGRGASGDDDPPVRIPGMSLDELERVAILRTVDSSSTVAEAAEILGISERTLYYRLRKYRDEDGEE